MRALGAAAKPRDFLQRQLQLSCTSTLISNLKLFQQGQKKIKSDCRITVRCLIPLLGYNATFLSGRLGAGDYIQHTNQIALNEVSFSRKVMCSLRLADTLNASHLCLPSLPQMAFILASQEHTRQGTKGIVPHQLGWRSSYEEPLLACSRAQPQGRRCRGAVAAGPLPDGTSGSSWMLTHLGHVAKWAWTSLGDGSQHPGHVASTQGAISNCG